MQFRVCRSVFQDVNCFNSGTALSHGYGNRISVLLSIYLGVCSMECGAVVNNTLQSGWIIFGLKEQVCNYSCTLKELNILYLGRDYSWYLAY